MKKKNEEKLSACRTQIHFYPEREKEKKANCTSEKKLAIKKNEQKLSHGKLYEERVLCTMKLNKYKG